MNNLGLSSFMKTVPVEIEIRFGTHNQRIRATWVGQREGEYLIMEVPRRYSWIELQDWFSSCTGVVIRGVMEQGQVFAAAAQVLGTAPRPFRSLYLSYPEKFEERSLRKVPRLRVDLDASLSFAKEVAPPADLAESFTALPGRIKDISVTGIAFETSEPLPCSQESITNQLIELSITDEGRELLKVLGEVRSCRRLAENCFLLGLAIDSRNAEYQQALNKLVLHSKHIKQVISGTI